MKGKSSERMVVMETDIPKLTLLIEDKLMRWMNKWLLFPSTCRLKPGQVPEGPETGPGFRW